MKIASAYCDGGCIKKNPSRDGGTWAWLHLSAADDIVRSESGVILPEQATLPAVSNNLTELLAAVLCMESLPFFFGGTLYTDSHVTRCRLVNRRPSFHGIPDWLRDRTWQARERMGLDFQVVLLDGHPTKAQLRSGVGKRGNPCSRWNCLADEMCGKRAAEFVAQLAMAAKEAI